MGWGRNASIRRTSLLFAVPQHAFEGKGAEGDIETYENVTMPGPGHLLIHELACKSLRLWLLNWLGSKLLSGMPMFDPWLD